MSDTKEYISNITLPNGETKYVKDSDLTIALNDSVNSLNNKIDSNTSKISINTNDIATNTSNIATNTSNIATNTSDIATNTSNIATNTSNIATNTSNIETNTSSIATNTSNIETNKTNLKNATTYSTTETPIGTWITGRTIYRKVIAYTGELSNGDNLVNHGIKKLIRVIHADLHLASGYMAPYFAIKSGTTGLTGIVKVDDTNVTIRCVDETWSSHDLYITLEYTRED